MWNRVVSHLSNLEDVATNYLRRFPCMAEYTYDPISARITLFLLVVGTMAFINELYITIEMTFLQKETYAELNKAPLNVEDLRNHRMVMDDEFHGREWWDEKSGIVIEEFESRERFFAKPVHVAHVYVECNIIDGETGSDLLSRPFQFHIEFSPEEYENEKRPEFGCKLIVLRRKLYHFFKETELYQELVAHNSKKDESVRFTVSSGVKIYNAAKELLPTAIDDIQLCFLKIETGDSIRCDFVV